jgi:site-specific DNA recombinase
MSRSAFHVAIRNPVYCGKVFIEKYKDEEAHLVQGQHQPLISEHLFYKVQNFLDGNIRKERPSTKIEADDNFPLRGFLTCPKCHKNLTGSASKGSKGVFYYYYHCLPSCGFRKSAPEANKLFERELEKFEFTPAIKEILEEMLMMNYRTFIEPSGDKRKIIIDEIEKLNLKISKARELLLEDKIDADDYRDTKDFCKKSIENLEVELANSLQVKRKGKDVKVALKEALNGLTNISKLYKDGETEIKRRIVGSIFPQKLEFDGTNYRTQRVNTIAHHIFMTNSNLRNRKNRTNEEIFDLSGLVAKTGVEPVTSGL